MAAEVYGTTKFDHGEYMGKVLITTAEGSAVSVPCEDILKFAASFARNQQMVALDRMDWQEILGMRKGKR